MISVAIANFERMISAGRDSALLRFSLGNEYLKIGDPSGAAEHLEKAVLLDAGYSAAWKLLGKALTECGRLERASQLFNAFLLKKIIPTDPAALEAGASACVDLLKDRGLA